MYKQVAEYPWRIKSVRPELAEGRRDGGNVHGSTSSPRTEINKLARIPCQFSKTKKAQIFLTDALLVYGADGDAHGGANVAGGRTPGETRLDNFVENKIGCTIVRPLQRRG